MRGILADNNVTGHFQVLRRFLNDESRREFWNQLNCLTPTFEDLGLPPDSSDLVVWKKCQDLGLVLLTANRNAKGLESLEWTIRTYSNPESLPVFTVANPKRMLQEKSYGERVADRLLEYLIDMENYRGTGRIYLP